MSNTSKTELRSAVDVMSDVEEVTNKLLELPDVIQLLVENLKLDERDWTQEEEYDLVARRNMVYNVLSLVQRTVWEVNEGIEAISIRKAQTEEAAAPTKVTAAN